MTPLRLKLAAFASAAAVLGFSLAARAADYQLLAPLPLGDGGSQVTSITFSQYVANGYRFGIVGAGVLAVVMIIWGGFDYVLTDAVSGKSAGKKKIENAIIGLLIALASYAILNTINPCLVQPAASGNILPPLEGGADSGCKAQ